jgi:hypothetical protein
MVCRHYACSRPRDQPYLICADAVELLNTTFAGRYVGFIVCRMRRTMFTFTASNLPSFICLKIMDFICREVRIFKQIHDACMLDLTSVLLVAWLNGGWRVFV